MKYRFDPTEAHKRIVAPLAGAWIEIFCHPLLTTTIPVAPLAGAWIEILTDY